MNIGILGAGNIGSTIGKKWVEAGHRVTFGVRQVNAPKVKTLLAECDGQAAAATVTQTIEASELILFAIPGRAMAETAATHGAALDGKILIDASNQINQPVMNSLAALQEAAPSARLYRAFNNLGWEVFAQPRFGETQADLFYCGHGGPAQAAVQALIAEVGIRPIYLGGLDTAGIVDNLTRLWFILTMEQNRGRHLAFRMLQSS
jgi:predicted dinucleotide-binding enzyme